MFRLIKVFSKCQFDKQLLLHYAIILFIAAVPTITWFRGDFLITTLDFDFPLNLTKTLGRSFFYWDDIELGSPNSRILAWAIPWEILRSIFNSLGFSVYVNEKIIFFLYHALAGLSMYYLVNSIWSERIYRRGALFAACFYIVNPMKSLFLVWPITPNYATLPLLLALFIRGVRESKGMPYITKMAILWILTTNSIYINPVFAIADWAPLFLYLGWYLFIESDSPKRLDALRFTVMLFLVWVCLNGYWLISYVVSFQEEIDAANLLAFGSSDANAYYLNTLPMSGGLHLMGEWFLESSWNGDPYVPWAFVYDSPIFIFMGFLIPLLSFSVILWRRKESNTFYFFLLSMIGLLMVTGPNSPFGGVVQHIWLNTFIGSLFRSVLQKFGGYVLLGYSVLLAITITSLESKFQVYTKKFCKINKLVPRTGRFFIQVPFIFICFLFIIIYSWIYWLGDYVRLFNGPINPASRVEIPTYYYDAADWLNVKGEDFRLAIIPTGLAYVNLQWGYGFLGADTSMWLFNKSIYNDRMTGFSELINFGNSPWVDISKVFRLLNIKYFMFHNDTNWKAAEDWPWIDYISPKEFKDLMRNQPDISFEREIGELDFYGINEPLPHIYSAPEAVVVSGDPTTMSSLAGSNYLEGYPLVAFSSQLQGKEGANLRGMLDKAKIFLSSKMIAETETLPDLVEQEPGYSISYILSPEEVNESQKYLRVPKTANYQVRARISPNIQHSNTYLLPKSTNWKKELETGDWQISGSEQLSAGGGVEQIQKPIIFFGDGWYEEVRDHKRIWRWGNNDMTLVILNPNANSLHGDLSLLVSTIYERDLVITVNDQDSEILKLNANYDQTPRIPLVDFLRERIYSKPIYPFPYEARFPAEWSVITVESVTLNPGENQIVLHTPKGTDVLNDLLGNGDDREVSIAIWDDVSFDGEELGYNLEDRNGDSGKKSKDSKINSQYELNFVNRNLELILHLDGDSNEQEFVLLNREMESIDLEEYPLFRFQYRVSDPAIATVDAVFGIDYTGDRQIDGYVTAQPYLIDGGWQINLNLFDEAKKSFPEQYYWDRRDLHLVNLFLVPHKRWGVDVKHLGRSGIYTFQFGELNLYNERSIIVPDDEEFGSFEKWSDWFVTDVDNSFEFQGNKGVQQRIPYPAKTIKDGEQIDPVVNLFDLPLIKLNGQPVSFRPPDGQENLLDWKGYWLEPETVSLIAGIHDLEILSHPTLQVDLVEIANTPYETEESNAKIAFRKVNPTRYNVEVDTEDDFWLVFSESFHPDWKAYIVESRSMDDKSWFEWSALLIWLMERDQRSELTEHYQVNAYANGWYVPETGKYSITLEFTPQRLFEIGVIISSLTFISCVAYLARDWLRKGKD